MHGSNGNTPTLLLSQLLSTSADTSLTTPANSWPGTIGIRWAPSVYARGMSEPQMPQAFTSTNTWLDSRSGTGRSSISSFPISLSNNAFKTFQILLSCNLKIVLFTFNHPDFHPG